MDSQTLDHLRSWVGRREQVDDLIAPSRVAALAATLDRDDPAPLPGDALPPPWHWTLCVAAARQSALGPDGHPARGGFLPPVPLPRRMWAGGRLGFPQPLRVGEAVQRRSQVISVEHKSGRSGELVFVLVRHEFHGANGLAITEEHDIVYRELPSAVGSAPTAGFAQPAGSAGAEQCSAKPPRHPAPTLAAAPASCAWQREIVPDDVLLFRYSALSFNGHRIHYDRRYVTEVEGYPGLVVHGPLIATLLLDLLRRNLPTAAIAAFEFKALKPLFDIAPFSVHGQPEGDGRTVRLWATDAEGWLAMSASASLA
ncbi:MAG: MaoC family dehydratase N-terminal domain-containing protein [Sulfuritalea sp.]|nr:MaoC family dehydratase N-terminal domain-containing protein [Sulfuritalea sp.]